MLVTMDTTLKNTDEISAFMDHAFQSRICSDLET